MKKKYGFQKIKRKSAKMVVGKEKFGKLQEIL